MRLFAAIDLDDGTRALARGVIERLRADDGARAAAVRWVAPDLLHLTVKFLGEVAPARLDAIRGALAAATAWTPPLALVPAGLGAFPTLARPRVLFLAVEPDPALAVLAERIDAALAPLGFPREERAFHPHVTLGRVDDPRGPRGRERGRGRGAAAERPRAGAADDARALGAAMARLQALAVGAPPFAASGLALVRSDLARGGPRYTTIETFPFEG